MFYTVEKMAAIQADAKFYRLDAPEGFFETPPEQLMQICNGASPEHWSKLKRQALTAATGRYEPAFAIHDVEYTPPHTGTRSAADKRLKRNMVKIWRRDFGVWRWFSRAGRLERLVIIPAVYAAVALAGSAAWQEAAR